MWHSAAKTIDFFLIKKDLIFTIEKIVWLDAFLMTICCALGVLAMDLGKNTV